MLRQAVLSAFGSLFVISGAASALAQGAQDYPNKPITLIVPWNAGGSTDVYFRALGEAASKELGQPVVVDNKAGGSGTLGPVTMALSANTICGKNRSFGLRCRSRICSSRRPSAPHQFTGPTPTAR